MRNQLFGKIAVIPMVFTDTMLCFLQCDIRSRFYLQNLRCLIVLAMGFLLVLRLRGYIQSNHSAIYHLFSSMLEINSHV